MQITANFVKCLSDLRQIKLGRKNASIYRLTVGSFGAKWRQKLYLIFASRKSHEFAYANPSHAKLFRNFSKILEILLMSADDTQLVVTADHRAMASFGSFWRPNGRPKSVEISCEISRKIKILNFNF